MNEPPHTSLRGESVFSCSRGRSGSQLLDSAMAGQCGAPLLLSLLLLVQRESLCEAAERRTVRAGDTVTLDCDIGFKQETLWFGQRDAETPFLSILATKKTAVDELFSRFSRGDDPRFTVVWESDKDPRGSASLRIQSITEADLALYYCVERGEGGLVLGNGTRLVYETSNQHPAPCVLSWALLGCVSAGCLLLSGCLCCLWRRRGGVQCVGAQRSPGQSTSEGAAQGEDAESDYATVEVHTDYNYANSEQAVYILQGRPQ
ncbi:uncharacterized protein LOC136711096 [Amia ocellicauda]|uniref:uncharacterized protein LOC136711096 n=1 Tax=Amia ocellicauda TaxID=2972642 RepID=UPI00346493F3